MDDFTFCRECGAELNSENNTLAPDLCNSCEEKLAAEFLSNDNLMPQGKDWKQLLEAARETRSEAALAAIGRYILWFLGE